MSPPASRSTRTATSTSAAPPTPPIFPRRRRATSRPRPNARSLHRLRGQDQCRCHQTAVCDLSRRRAASPPTRAASPSIARATCTSPEWPWAQNFPVTPGRLPHHRLSVHVHRLRHQDQRRGHGAGLLDLPRPGHWAISAPRSRPLANMAIAVDSAGNAYVAGATARPQLSRPPAAPFNRRSA